MLLVLIAAVVGYAIGQWPGAIVGAAIVMGSGVLLRQLTPKADREPFFEFQMRTNEQFRAMVLDGFQSQRRPRETFVDYLMRTQPEYRETVLARRRLHSGHTSDLSISERPSA